MISFLYFSALCFSVNSYSTSSFLESSNIPEIGESSDNQISSQEYVRLGLVNVLALARVNGIIQDPLSDFYIQQLGMKISSSVEFSNESDSETYFFIVASRAINAFAMPGGYIGLNYGLVINSKSEDMLASVIAHELAHVAKRHLLSAKEEASKNSGLLIAGIIAGLLASASSKTTNSSIGNALLFGSLGASAEKQLSFSRKQEEESDLLGLQYLSRSGYDPKGMLEFHELLASLTSGSQVPEYLSTHPNSGTRIAEIALRTGHQTSANIPVTIRHTWFPYIKVRLHALDDLKEIALPQENESLNSFELYSIAMWHQRNKNYAKSNLFYEKTIATDPDNEYLLYSQAENYYDQKEFSKAISILKRLVSLYPYFTPARILLAQNYIETKDTINFCSTVEYAALPTSSKRVIYLRDQMVFKLRADCSLVKGKILEYHLLLANSILASGNIQGAYQQLKLALRIKNSNENEKVIIHKQLQLLHELDPENIPQIKTEKGQ